MEILTDIEDVPPIRKSAVAVGVFDGVHRAHAAILEKLIETAKQINGSSVVVTFDPHPMKIVSEERYGYDFFLLNTLEEKIEHIRKYNIDYLLVVKFNEQFAETNYEEFTKDILMAQLNVDTLVMGYNHSIGNEREGNIESMQMMAEKYGLKIKVLPQIMYEHEIVSSTTIRNALLSGEVSLANALLGYNYFRSGELGGKIFYPYRNDKLLPAYGVYQCMLSDTDNSEEVVCEVENKILIITELINKYDDEARITFLSKMDMD
ncbi:MAG: FAD synthetase family protein [Bacteroidales bacterium]|jgi:riboflavin kinase/FMN adenylyltransferase|nr:FAD synthetase family protein [Bacteroidales bacterium]